jgi:hypothetical protein
VILGHAGGELAWIAFAMLVAGFVKGTTGLGYSTTCLPLLALALGLKDSLPLVLAPSLASNVAVMASAGSPWPAARRFGWMLLLAPVGVIAGVVLLGRIESAAAGAALGIALIAWCAFALGRPEWRLAARFERPLLAPVGLATGMVNGVPGSQVLPVTPFLMSLRVPPELMVMTLNLSFTLSSVAMAAGLASLGILNAETGTVSLAGVAVAIAGVRAGTALRRRLADEVFRVGVLLVLGVAGAALILRAL